MEELELFPEVAKMPLFFANFLAKEAIVINQGGTSSGKSQALIRLMFFYAIYYSKYKIEVAGGTYDKLESDTLEIAESLVRDNFLLQSFIKSFHKTKHTFYFKNGSKIVFKSYEKPKDADGPKRDILYISEARNFPWATAEQLIMRTKFKTFIDYNPVAAFWAHDNLINCKTVNNTKEYPSVKVLRSWHIHNNFISQEMRNKIENIADKELWKAYARGLTANITGIIYRNFEEILTMPQNPRTIIWGMDLGFTNDPTVLLKLVLNENGYDCIVQSFGYAPGIPAGDIAHILHENGYKRGQPLYMDHNKTMQIQLRQLGINAIHAFKKDVEAGILYCRNIKAAFTSDSTMFKDEVRRHSFLMDANGKTTNNPEHQHSHGPSAFRYGYYTHAIRHKLVKGVNFVND